VEGIRGSSRALLDACVCVRRQEENEGERGDRAMGSVGLGLRGRGWALGHGGEEAAEKDGPAWEAGWALSLSSFFSLFPQPEL